MGEAVASQSASTGADPVHGGPSDEEGDYSQQRTR